MVTLVLDCPLQYYSPTWRMGGSCFEASVLIVLCRRCRPLCKTVWLQRVGEKDKENFGCKNRSTFFSLGTFLKNTV
uniref:Uncharacterized protein n=1 Tax=Mastacembelus armatus TaxID=205130 RepID=A0A7N8YBJ4_9TELE